MNELTVLLVEDDIATCNRFGYYIDTKEDIILVNTTNNSKQALIDISYYHPDAVILDLELHHGAGNGVQVLEGLADTRDKPFILICTNNSSDTIYEYARQLGADFIMYKHQEDYSEKNVVDFLYSIKNIIKRKKAQSLINYHDTPEQRDKHITRLICKELDLVGINPKSSGYKYLIEAIQIIINKSDHNICAMVAQVYKKTESSVERAMQYAINRAWYTMDIDELIANYTARITSEKGCPTVNEFVYYYATKIKNMM